MFLKTEKGKENEKESEKISQFFGQMRSVFRWIIERSALDVGDCVHLVLLVTGHVLAIELALRLDGVSSDVSATANC
jgi:hypothetical protein